MISNLTENKGSQETLKIKSWIGTDESGKGDYFGPLVVAAVHVDSKTAAALSDIGVKDCKKVSDKKVKQLAMQIKKVTTHNVVMIGNPKYNELYNKFNNLNTMLAWAHARAIENVLDNTDCKYVLTDKFADSKVLLKSLMQKGKDIKLEQRTKAEDDIAVAAASILARAAFLYGIEKLAKEANMELSKGASSKVLEQAKAYVAKNGSKSLGKIAKLHFKSTKTVLG